MITCTEYERDEPRWISHRHPCRKPDLDRRAACDVRTPKARRQSCRVVCNDKVPPLEQRCKSAARHIPYVASGVNYQQLGCFLVRALGGDHGCATRQDVPLVNNATLIASTISSAESSGRFNVDGSASGTASACSGVSMSPGPTERNMTLAALASSAQIAVRWRNADLLAPYGPQPG